MSVKFILMTYNVHSCVGRDNKADPGRIAEVIASFSPDIVALQELDIELSRTGSVDQVKEIADCLNMHFHFHPSFGIEEGYFGNAVLSRYPMRLVKAGELPTSDYRRLPEKRGALWVELNLKGYSFKLINTHLGLNRKERRLQAETLMGPEWLGSTNHSKRTILCGDFNLSPMSSIYRKITARFRDAQKHSAGIRPRSTWPGWFPFMRIDHIFISSDILVNITSVPKTPLTKQASDHLPLVVQMEISDEGKERPQ